MAGLLSEVKQPGLLASTQHPREAAWGSGTPRGLRLSLLHSHEAVLPMFLAALLFCVELESKTHRPMMVRMGTCKAHSWLKLPRDFIAHYRRWNTMGFLLGSRVCFLRRDP